MTEVSTIYNRFTALSKRALVGARDVAASIGHDFIGTEHLLIGLAQTAGRASEVLRARGVELDRLRSEVERDLGARGVLATRGADARTALATVGIDVGEIQRLADVAFGSGSFQFPRPAFSLTAKRAIKAALEAARDLGAEQIDTEHLLLGVLAAADNPALEPLQAFGIDLAELRSALLARTTER
ncbi:MAG: Clp protease N-terminal domain-containing protein [Actinomycetes bacterium]